MIISVQKLPLTVYAVIEQTGPLFALIASVFILKEWISAVETLLGFVAFFGVVLVIQPPLAVFDLVNGNNSATLTTRQYLMTVVAVFAPLMFSTSKVLVRKMSTKGQPTPLSVATFSMATVSLISGFIIQFLDSGFNYLNCLSTTQVYYLFAALMLSTCNQIVTYYATKFEKATIIMIIITLKIPILFIADVILYPEQVENYNFLQYIGGAIVFCSVFAMMGYNYLRQTAKAGR